MSKELTNKEILELKRVKIELCKKISKRTEKFLQKTKYKNYGKY